MSRHLAVLAAVRVHHYFLGSYVLLRTSLLVTFSLLLMQVLHIYSIPYSIALLIVLGVPSKAFAVTHCSWLISQPQGRMLPADCLAISTHIPSFPEPIDEESNLLRFNSWNAPFSPQAVLHHGSCYVRISYIQGYPLRTIDDGMLFVEYAHWIIWHTPMVPLSEMSLSKIWRAVKSGLQDIADQCLAVNRIGTAWGAVEIPSEELTYAVEILDPYKRRFIEEHYKMEAKGALDHQATIVRFPNKFEVAVYDVP